MAFDFYSAYVMSAPGFPPEIVLGVHEGVSNGSPDGEEHGGVWFLLTHGQHRGHFLEGDPEEQPDGEVALQTPDDIFQFERLTLDRWLEVGKQGLIVGFDKLEAKFHSDEEIQQFYLHEFLDDVWLKWVDRQGNLPNQ